MKPYEKMVTYEAMVVGFIDATARFERSVGRRDAVLAYAALFEALNWAVTLEDRVREHWVPDGEPLDWEWRERLPNAEVMGAVRFARNRAHHQWADAMVVTTRTLPYRFPLLIPDWKWRAAADLPPGDPTRPDPSARRPIAISSKGGQCG